MKMKWLLNLTVLAIMVSTPVWANEGAQSEGFQGKNAGKHAGKMAHILKKLDTNGDKSVSLEEMVAGVEDRFDKLDADGDGIITKAEFISRVEERFSKMDRNGDGLVNKDDFAAMRKKMKENRGKNPFPKEG